ncbi:MAG: metallophosphoesterase [Planctomycetaceae bacterium]
MHDLIGDIHGHADALERLLNTLGYTRQHGIYRHTDRQVIFLGDFIDRGPHIRETLEIVRPMIDSGAALSVMGNLELNALAYHTPYRENPVSSSGYAPPRIPISTPRRCGGCRPAN